jgi:LEA14-like dessication related protein
MRLRIAAVMMVLAPFILTATGCAGGRPKACVDEVRYSNFTMKSVDLLFDVAVDNPYYVPLPLEKMDYMLCSADTGLATGSAQVDTLAPNRGVQTVTVPVTVNIDKLAPLGAIVPVKADMVLAVDSPFMGDIGLKFVTETRIPVPAAPEVEVPTMEWSTFTWDKAVGVATVNILNPNTFDISVEKWEYRLVLGGHELIQGVTEEVPVLEAGATAQITIPVDMVPSRLGEAVFRAMAEEDAEYDAVGIMNLGTEFGPLKATLATGGGTDIER